MRSFVPPPEPKDNARLVALLIDNEHASFSAVEDETSGYGSLMHRLTNSELESKLTALFTRYPAGPDAGKRFIEPFNALIASAVQPLGIDTRESLVTLSDQLLDQVAEFERATPEMRGVMLKAMSSIDLGTPSFNTLVLGGAAFFSSFAGPSQTIPNPAHDVTLPSVQAAAHTPKTKPTQADAATVARWKDTYRTHFKTATQTKAYYAYSTDWAPQSYSDDEGKTHRIGYGTPLTGKGAKALVEHSGFDATALLNGKAILDEPGARLLAHAEAVQAADRLVEQSGAHKLTYAQHMRVMDAVHGAKSPLMKAARAQAQHPENFVFHSKSTHDKPNLHNRGGIDHPKSVAMAKSTRHKHHLKNNVELGLRNNPNDYINRADANRLREKFAALPKRRIGDPGDPFYGVFAELMMLFEKFEPTMYKDGPKDKHGHATGNPTIAIGHLLKNVSTGETTKDITDQVLGKGMYNHCMSGKPITRAQAMKLVIYHAITKEATLRKEGKIGAEVWDGLTAVQEASLLSVAFNGGPGLVHDGICEPVRRGDFQEAAHQICYRLNRQKLGGLDPRRATESWFLDGVEKDYKPEVAAKRFTQQIKSLKPRTMLQLHVPDENYLQKFVQRIALKQTIIAESTANPDSVLVVTPTEHGKKMETVSWADLTQRFPTIDIDNNSDRSR